MIFRLVNVMFWQFKKSLCRLNIGWKIWQLIITLPTVVVAKYCDEHICLYVSLWQYLRNHTHYLYQFFCACCLWPWFTPPPAGWQNPKGKGHFWGFSPLTVHCNVFAAKGIIWSPITSCSRRDHSVAAALLQMRLARKGVTGVHSTGEVWCTMALFFFITSV